MAAGLPLKKGKGFSKKKSLKKEGKLKGKQTAWPSSAFLEKDGRATGWVCRFRRGGMALVRLAFPVFFLLAAAEFAAATRSPSAFVQNAIYSNRITIFSKTYCP
jgi:glutaredoxin 3